MNRHLRLVFLFSILSSPALSTYAAETKTSLNQLAVNGISEVRQSLDMGLLEVRGSSCQVESGSRVLAPVEGSEHRFVIPVGIYLSKSESQKIVRGACAFALPLKAHAGMKIVVANTSQLVSLRAYPQAKAKIEIEIFKAGEIGEKQSRLAEAQDKTARLAEVLRQREAVVESECGGNMILRGNVSGFILGTGQGRVFARDLELDMIEVPCE